MNFLSAEQLIIDRLESQLSKPTKVMSVMDISTIKDLSQFAPVVYITYDGMSDQSKSNTGAAQKVLQRWSVVTAVRGMNQSHTGFDARTEAGKILDEVLTSLLGYQLSPKHFYFRLVDAPGAFYDGGFVFFPLIFETYITLVGKQT